MKLEQQIIKLIQMNRFIILKIIFLLLVTSIVEGQDIEKLIGSKPFDFSGRVYVGTSFYNVQNKYSYRAPFSYMLSGSPTISIYGFKFPFRFSFRDNKFGFSKPHNRFSLKPSYKWIKLHLGHCNMTFSPYSLAGHTFWGAGVDLTPYGFRISAMYGTLENARYQTDTMNISQELLKQYKRKAFAVRIGLGSGDEKFDLNFFNAEDDPSSKDNPYSQPARNIIVGLSLGTSIIKSFKIKGNLYASFITENINAKGLEKLIDTNNGVVKKIIKTTEVNLSSRLNFAGDLGLYLRLKRFTIGAKYKRISPQYTSFGAYYFNNDFENTTLNSSIRLFKGKIKLKGSYGLQRNNLSNLRSFSNYRTIGSANIFILANRHFNINLNYANYQTEQKDGLLIVNDTLRLTQLNERFNISPGFTFGNKKLKHSIRLNTSYQKFNYANNPNNTKPDNYIVGAYINYSIKHKKSKAKVKFGLNYHKTNYANINSERYGFTAGFNKAIFDKKLKTNISTTWNKNITNYKSDGHIMSIRFRSNFRLNKKQGFVLSFSYLNKNTIIQKPYAEFRGRLSYSLSF